MSGELLRLARERSSAWHLGAGFEETEPLRAVVLDEGRREDRAVVFLLRDRDRRPCVVFKVGRAAETFALEREFHVLQEILASLPKDDAHSIPRPLELLSWRDLTIMVTGYVSGSKPILPGLGQGFHPASAHSLRRFVRRVAAFSSRLPSAAKRGTGSELGRTVDSFLREVAPRLGAPADRLESLAARLERTDIEWRAKWQHKDPAVGNVLFRRGRTSLVDWEHASDEGPPWFDVAYVPLALALLCHRQIGTGSVEEASSHVLGEHTWVGKILRQELEHAWHFDIPPSWAVTITALDAALSRFQRGSPQWIPWASLAVALVEDHDGSKFGWFAPSW